MTSFTQGMRFPYYIFYWMNPKYLYREIKYIIQRCKRGWSDKDTWAGGEHIAEISAGILRYLQQDQEIVDFNEYFELNFKVNKDYKDFNAVADDLMSVIDFERSDAKFEDFNGKVDEYSAHLNELYEKQRKAMVFVAKNLNKFWW